MNNLAHQFYLDDLEQVAETEALALTAMRDIVGGKAIEDLEYPLLSALADYANSYAQDHLRRQEDYRDSVPF